MVQGWKTLSSRSLALGLIVAFALEGCVTYPSTVALEGQDAATAERDALECRSQAADEVEHPLAVALGTKLAWALGGAVLGTVVVMGMLADRSSPPGGDPKWIPVAIGGGAGLGFVIGSITGTFKGADKASRAARGREQAFSRCMTGRGYQLDE